VSASRRRRAESRSSAEAQAYVSPAGPSAWKSAVLKASACNGAGVLSSTASTRACAAAARRARVTGPGGGEEGAVPGGADD